MRDRDRRRQGRAGFVLKNKLICSQVLNETDNTNRTKHSTNKIKKTR